MSSTLQLSSAMWDRAVKYIPNGCQTLSKGPERYVNGVYPKMLISGHGCEVQDEFGKRYFDYISGLGSNLLGYSNPAVDDVVKESIVNGQVLLSLPHPKEGELAWRLSLITGFPKVKFFKTGSESTSAAVRLARAYTGKEVILMCGYNGWHDWAAQTYDRKAGVCSEQTRKCEYNNLASWESHLNRGDVAAVILEPVQFDSPKDGFLETLIKLAHKAGALVIFDEIVNGLRFGANGSCGFLGVKGDLVCMGKALGNGYAVSALLGPEEVMKTFERPDFIASGTFSGELIGISAGLAVLESIGQAAFTDYPVNVIWQSGTILKTGFNNICNDLGLESVSCVGYAPRTKFVFPTDGHKALFWQECVKREILFGYCNFTTYSHGNHVTQKTLSVCRDALKVVKDNWNNPKERLEGEMPKSVMR